MVHFPACPTKINQIRRQVYLWPMDPIWISHNFGYPAIPSNSHLSAQAPAASSREILANAWPKHVRVWPPVARATGPKPSWCWRWWAGVGGPRFH